MEHKEILKTYKGRLYLSEQEEKTILSWKSSCRKVWNMANEERLQQRKIIVDALKNEQQIPKLPKINNFSQNKLLTTWRNAEETKWLSNTPCIIQQNVLIVLEKSWKRCKSNIGGVPRFKKWNDSIGIAIPPQAYSFNAKKSTVDLPKLKNVKVYFDRPVKGELRTCNITQDAGQWFISIATKQLVPVILNPNKNKSIGIDRGVTCVIADSNGDTIKGKSYVEGLEKTILRRQRNIARKMEARKKLPKDENGRLPRQSKRLEKERLLLAKKLQQVRRRREDANHNISHYYSSNYETVVMEELKTSNMTKSAKGTAEKPGKNVRAKSGLNKAILSRGWYQLQLFLAYKLNYMGGRMILVPPQYTSQTCSSCGHIDAESRDKTSFICTNCGHEAHADINAAKNILDKGLEMLNTNSYVEDKHTKILSSKESNLKKSEKKKTKKSKKIENNILVES